MKPTYGLTEADVERMVEDSFTYAEADVETRLLIETRNEADTVLTHVDARARARAARLRRRRGAAGDRGGGGGAPRRRARGRTATPSASGPPS